MRSDARVVGLSLLIALSGCRQMVEPIERVDDDGGLLTFQVLAPDGLPVVDDVVGLSSDRYRSYDEGALSQSISLDANGRGTIVVPNSGPYDLRVDAGAAELEWESRIFYGLRPGPELQVLRYPARDIEIELEIAGPELEWTSPPTMLVRRPHPVSRFQDEFRFLFADGRVAMHAADLLGEGVEVRLVALAEGEAPSFALERSGAEVLEAGAIRVELLPLVVQLTRGGSSFEGGISVAVETWPDAARLLVGFPNVHSAGGALALWTPGGEVLVDLDPTASSGVLSQRRWLDVQGEVELQVELGLHRVDVALWTADGAPLVGAFVRVGTPLGSTARTSDDFGETQFYLNPGHYSLALPSEFGAAQDRFLDVASDTTLVYQVMP